MGFHELSRFSRPRPGCQLPGAMPLHPAEVRRRGEDLLPDLTSGNRGNPWVPWNFSIQIDRFSAGTESSWSMLDDFHNIDVLFV